MLKVLVVAQTPPPLHGQAVMNQLLLEGSYEKIELHHVRMGFSETIQDVGRADLGKVLHLGLLIARVTAARIRTGATALYYPPASPNFAPFVRDCFFLFAVRWMFPRMVFHFHANGISEYARRLPFFFRWLYRYAYGKPDLSICLSSLATADAVDFRSRRIAIVPNGIPDQPEAEDRKEMANPPTILYLGTVSEEKGVGVLLRSLAILAKSGIPFQCVIAGSFASREMASKLKTQCASMKLDEYVHWRGAVTGSVKWECYQEADIFCFPTFYETEGFPVVLLEAMMFSLPCVSTIWRAIPEIVLDDKTGFLVPVKDADAAANRLGRLLRDPILRRVMGNTARRRFLEHYRVEAFRESMEKALLFATEE